VRRLVTKMRVGHRTPHPLPAEKCPPMLHLVGWYACGLHGGEGQGDDVGGAAATAARAREAPNGAPRGAGLLETFLALLAGNPARRGALWCTTGDFSPETG
jgi:hypothetical protein